MKPRVMRSLGPFCPGAVAAAESTKGAVSVAAEVIFRNWRRLKMLCMIADSCGPLPRPAIKFFRYPERYARSPA